MEIPLELSRVFYKQIQKKYRILYDIWHVIDLVYIPRPYQVTQSICQHTDQVMGQAQKPSRAILEGVLPWAKHLPALPASPFWQYS